MPKLPEKKQAASDVPTVPLALLLVLICGGGFFGLLSLVFPGAGMLGVTLMILGLFFVAQYYVWGRWVYRWAVAKEARDEAKKTQP
ncbi:MAG: hypothetical protein R3C59_30895 [Planctomycetaceae bacterium]